MVSERILTKHDIDTNFISFIEQNGDASSIRMKI